MESVLLYSQCYAHLKRSESSTARRILNALDQKVPASAARDELRTEVLDSLAAFRRDILQWLQSELKFQVEDDPSKSSPLA